MNVNVQAAVAALKAQISTMQTQLQAKVNAAITNISDSNVKASGRFHLSLSLLLTLLLSFALFPSRSLALSLSLHLLLPSSPSSLSLFVLSLNRSTLSDAGAKAGEHCLRRQHLHESEG